MLHRPVEPARIFGNFEQFVTRVRPQLDSSAGREIADARNEVVVWEVRLPSLDANHRGL